MPARKIPLIWSSPKAKDQTCFKYDPASQRLSKIGCCICNERTPSPFTLTSWSFAGSDVLHLQAFWTPSLNARRYTVNFLISDTYPVSQTSTIIESYPNVSSGDLLPLTSAYDFITCKFFGVQVVASNSCATVRYSNLLDGSQILPSIFGTVAPETATLSFDATNITISFSDGINVQRYNVYLYDVTNNQFALTNAILPNISTIVSPYIIPYSYLTPYAVTSPPLITGNQYKLIITTENAGLVCSDEKDYTPVVFTETFPL